MPEFEADVDGQFVKEKKTEGQLDSLCVCMCVCVCVCACVCVYLNEHICHQFECLCL